MVKLPHIINYSIDIMNLKFTLLLSSLLLSACANNGNISFLPGSGLDMKNKQVVYADNSTPEMSQAELNQRAVIYPINLSLVQQMREPESYARSNPALEAQKRNYRYRLGVGDVLSIKIFNQPDFNSYQQVGQSNGQGTVVDESGNIYYPLAGKVQARGKSLAEIQQIITQRLARYYKNPQLDVSILQYRAQSISVNGAVKQSGKFPLNDVPLTLLDAISLAGGLTEAADTNNIKWTRHGRDITISLQDLLQRGDAAQNQLLGNGDVIYVPSRADVQVYVMGEVGKQNVITIDNNGLNLTEALAKSEGISQSFSNATGVFVIRNTPRDVNGKDIYVYQLNLKDATAYALGTQFKLKPNDVVYVTTAPVTRWNRVLSQIMPSVSSISTVKNAFF